MLWSVYELVQPRLSLLLSSKYQNLVCLPYFIYVVQYLNSVYDYYAACFACKIENAL